MYMLLGIIVMTIFSEMCFVRIFFFFSFFTKINFKMSDNRKFILFKTDLVLNQIFGLTLTQCSLFVCVRVCVSVDP